MATTTDDVSIELDVAQSNRVSEADHPTTKDHERRYGKVRLTFSSKLDKWIVRPKKRGRLSTKITESYETCLTSDYTFFLSSFVRSIMNILPDYWTYTHLYLIILGVVVAFIGAAMDFLTIELGKGKRFLDDQVLKTTTKNIETTTFFIFIRGHFGVVNLSLSEESDSRSVGLGFTSFSRWFYCYIAIHDRLDYVQYRVSICCDVCYETNFCYCCWYVFD